MLETREDLDRLDDLLRASSARAGEHLRSIIDDTRTLEARDVVAVLEGMKVISPATATSQGEPRISASPDLLVLTCGESAETRRQCG